MHSVFHQANKTDQTSNYYNYKQLYKYMGVYHVCVLEIFKNIYHNEIIGVTNMSFLSINYNCF